MTVLRLAALAAFAALAASAAAPQPDEPRVLRKQAVPESEILRKPTPEYPPRALQNRIEGTVRFEALVGTDGRVERLRLLSGHPLLVEAARRAALRWAFRPARSGGQPARVLTFIEVIFELDRYGNPVNAAGSRPTPI